MPTPINDQPKGVRFELTQRISKSIKHENFIIYFFFLIVVVGLIGVWLPAGIPYVVGSPKEFDWMGTAKNLATYELALLGTSAADMFFLGDEANKTVRLACGLVCAVGVFFGVIASIAVHLCLALVTSVVGCLVSWVFWALSNSDNERLTGEVDPHNATGGDLSKLKGTLAGWKA